MGNLVTNTLKLSGAPADVARALIAIVGEVQAKESFLDAALGQSSEVKFHLSTAVPVPVKIGFTHGIEEHLENTGIAVMDVQGGKTDFLREKYARDPALIQMTAQDHIEALGLESLRGITLINRADSIMPGSILAGMRSIAAFKETGHFNWRTWRDAEWGTRQHSETASIKVDADGQTRITFDTVNTSPVAWFKAVAAGHPDVTMQGAAYDENTDYAVHFVSDGEGGLQVDETDDAESVFSAQVIVHDLDPDRDVQCDEYGMVGA